MKVANMNNYIKIKHLLIIDDDPLVRMLVAESLIAAGFDVNEAVDGASGLAQIEARRPDLVLLDVMMPGMDGYEVCRTLRARPELARIPVIMLTGLDDTASIERTYECGATDFIAKPINAALLNYRVRYALRASRMVDEIERHRTSLANAQRIARLGSWTWYPVTARFECSAEYQQIAGGHAFGPNCQWRDILRHVHPDDAARVAQTMDSAAGAGNACRMVYRILRDDGSLSTLYEQVEVFRDVSGDVCRIEGTTQDITERVAAEERIRQLADYDALTSLANRRLFSEAMHHGLNHSARKNTRAAVLDINIDRFKRINETLGHAAGDQALQEIARRILGSVRGSDIAATNEDTTKSGLSARMSGDGFAVFLTEVRRAEDAAMIARRLIDAIARPMQCGEHDFTVTASVGIAVYPDNGEDVSALLKNAEIAVHSAKKSGVGSYSFFNTEMNAKSLAKLEVENDLRGAIERNELVLFYQARVDVPTGRLIGAEALVRWQHPKRGLVPPNEFIPVAEESGLIIPLTAWVVRAACAQLQKWQRAGLAVVPLSVNLSAHSFREDGLVELIADSLREFNVAPSLLEGEITESVLMQDVERAIALLHALRAIGVELAMDDFGTGYSSLAYLKRFPLNVLKIDRAFVKDVLTDTHDAAIASAIIALGRTMGLTVVAEGMERVEQANFLLSLGCHRMQGFLFARPVPADAFAVYLREGLALPTGIRVGASGPGLAMPAGEAPSTISIVSQAQLSHSV
jgi:diguanylate cyclase (GGDEF)-like protein